MENETENTPLTDPEEHPKERRGPPPLGEPPASVSGTPLRGASPSGWTRPRNFLGEWAGTLGTVFLCGATISTLLRWFAEGTAWDLGGTIFSGILAWICYRMTISEKAIPDIRKRTQTAIGLAVFWALFFPIVLWGLGFK